MNSHGTFTNRRWIPPIALLLGLLSGPVTLVLFALFAQLVPDIRYLRIVDIEALLIWAGGALVFSVMSFMLYSPTGMDRKLSMVGVVASLVWLGAGSSLMVWVIFFFTPD